MDTSDQLCGDGSGSAALKKKVFTMNAYKVMITYTFAGLSKERILKNIKNMFNEGSMAIVAEEQYAEGGTHFHVYIETTKRTRYTTSLIKAIGAISGHIVEVTHRHRQMIAYVVKDNDYVCWPLGCEAQIATSVMSYGHRRTFGAIQSMKPSNFKQLKVDAILDGKKVFATDDVNLAARAQLLKR